MAPNDYDSLALRSSICVYLRDCTSPAGTRLVNGTMPIRIQFRPDATVPELEYMDEPVWKMRMNGALPLLTRYIFNSLGRMAKTSTSMN